MKVLIIDNNMDPIAWGASNLVRLAKLCPDSTVFVRRAPHEDLPKSPKEFDSIIVSGSKASALDKNPWVGKLMEFIKQTLDLQKPYLGVCFGHQILARTLGGIECVGTAATPEFGWTEVRLTRSSPLTAGMPTRFHTFSSHFEEVRRLPPELKNLAESDACQVQAYEHQHLPAFGIQFHPEKSCDEGKAILKHRKKIKQPPNLFNPTRSDELYNATLGVTLFENFLKIRTTRKTS